MSKLNGVFFDRSRTVQDETCPRSRYWGTEWRGVGLTPATDKEGKLYLPFGSAIHLGMELTAKGERADDPAFAALALLAPHIASMPEPFRKEQEALLYGMIAGYARSVWVQDQEVYDFVSAEDEIVVTTPTGEQVVAKPDLLLRRKEDGTLWYKEFKTTAWANEGWVLSWSHSAQLLTGALAVASRLSEPLHGSIIQGLYKGQKRGGKLGSIFCYANMMPDGSLSYEWKPRAEKVPVWELDGGMEKWIREMPMGILLQQFPATPPIMFNASLMDSWLREKVIREREIASVRSLDPLPEEVREKVFPMHIGACQPAIGSPCPFVNLCYTPQAQEDPLWHGYTWRKPHLTSDPAHAILALLNDEPIKGEGE